MCQDQINKFSCGCESVTDTNICNIGQITNQKCPEKKPGLTFSKRLRKWFDSLDSAVPLNPTEHAEEEVSRANWRKRSVKKVGTPCERCLALQVAFYELARRQRPQEWEYRLAKERLDALLRLCRVTSNTCIGQLINEVSREVRMNAVIRCEKAGRQLGFVKQVAEPHAMTLSPVHRCQDDD